jgi:hypothetical protein
VTITTRTDQCHFGHIRWHRGAHTAQHLNTLGDLVDELILLGMVFIEEQMQLVECWSRDLRWAALPDWPQFST